MARATARDAAHAALSGRIRIADGCDRTPESVLDELLGGFWPADAAAPLPPDDPQDAEVRGISDGDSVRLASRIGDTTLTPSSPTGCRWAWSTRRSTTR